MGEEFDVCLLVLFVKLNGHELVAKAVQATNLLAGTRLAVADFVLAGSVNTFAGVAYLRLTDKEQGGILLVLCRVDDGGRRNAVTYRRGQG